MKAAGLCMLRKTSEVGSWKVPQQGKSWEKTVKNILLDFLKLISDPLRKDWVENGL